MYTMVMMAALTTAPETTQFNGFFRDLAGGSGCHANGQSESNTANCQGNSCRGCCGGLFHGRILSFFSFFGDRGSCCGGSCHGSSCQGSCTGRSAAGSTCHGSSCNGNSCNGGRRDFDPGYYTSCNGSSCNGGNFAPMNIPTYPGGGYAQPYPAMTGSGYGSGCFGGTPMIIPGGGYDTVPFSPPTAVPSTERDTYRPTVVDDNARGTIIVRLPEDAKLFAEGRQLTLKTDVRKFVTPPLPSDRDAIYNMRVEYTRDGEVISRTKRITIRAGETKTIEFNDQTVQSPTVNPPELFAEKPALGTPMLPVIPPIPSIPSPSLPMGTPTVNKPQPLPPLGSGAVTVVPPPQALADRAKITVKLPAGATLYVDKKKNDRTDAVREFTTPALKKGELYTYILRAEWSRDGRPEYDERKVEFMAGELHTIDFTLPLMRASR